MGEQVAARFLKNLLVDFEGTKQVWQYGSGRCTLKTAHRKFFFKRKATSDFYDKKELRLNQFSQ